MGSTELTANLFRATQAEDKMRRERIVGKAKANTAHRDVGAKVRQTIKELGGTMPEELPTAESIRRLAPRVRKAIATASPRECRPRPTRESWSTEARPVSNLEHQPVTERAADPVGCAFAS